MIEIIFIVAILGILAAVSIPKLSQAGIVKTHKTTPTSTSTTEW